MNTMNPSTTTITCTTTTTTTQHDETPSRCAGGCGFFGTAEQHGFCSYCYKNYLKAEKERAAKLEESLTSMTINSETDCDPTRCGSCAKKLKLIPFRCRCGRSFCNAHRLPEAHDCTFDFKKAGRVVIGKQNPICKGDKMGTRI